MSKQKLMLKHVCLMLIMVMGLGACKKDAIKVDTPKSFTQLKSGTATDLSGGAMTLVLRPDGSAQFNPGGDIVYSGTYDISGKKITVKVPDMERKYTFTIISEQELEGECGEKLTLDR